MKWREVIEKKIIPEGYIKHAWFQFKRDHIGDYDWDADDWKRCKRDFEESEADADYVARYKII